MIKKFNSKTHEYKMLEQTMNTKTINYFFDELKKIEKETKQNFTAGEAFEIYVASVMTGKGSREAMDKCTLSGEASDGGIDVFFINPKKKILTLVQTKLIDFDQNYIRKMMTTYNDYIFKFNAKLHNDNKGIQKIRDLYKSHMITKVEYVFIGTNKIREETIKQQFKGNNVSVYSINEFITLAGIDFFQPNYESIFKLYLHKELNIPGGEIQETSDKNSWFIYVKGDEFIKQFANLNNFAIDSLFEENIRNKVTKNKFINEFKETIKESPEYFHLYNNGLTIVCSLVDSTNEALILTNPQIINGQQTVRALINIYRDNIDLSNIEVPIKVIKIENKEIIKKIARYSNNQTAVKESELNFIDDEYKQLVRMSNKEGYSLKGKKGTTSKSNVLKMSISKGELPLNEVIRSHAASYHPIEFLGDSKNRISSVVNKYFNDKQYIKQVLKENTFKNLIKIIENYDLYYSEKILREKEKLNKIKNMPKSEATKVASNNNKYLKFGISVFYNLSNRNKENHIIDKCIKNITKNNDGTINVFKNNSKINEELKKELKLII